MEAAPGARRASLQFSSKPLYFHFITLKICDALEPRIDRSSRTDFDLTSKKVDPIAFVNSTFPRYSHAPPPLPHSLVRVFRPTRFFHPRVWKGKRNFPFYFFPPFCFDERCNSIEARSSISKPFVFRREEEIERFWRKILPKNLYIMDKRKMRCWKKKLNKSNGLFISRT